MHNRIINYWRILGDSEKILWIAWFVTAICTIIYAPTPLAFELLIIFAIVSLMFSALDYTISTYVQRLINKLGKR